MGRFTQLIIIILIVTLSGCRPEPYTVNVGFTNGSTTGRHVISKMTITTISGGKANFAMGAVSGYPGAHATGGRMDPPAYIEGDWIEGWGFDDDEISAKPYHRISMTVPEDAEQKMKTMDNYYKNFNRDYGSMQVIVDGPRVRIYYSKDCSITLHDCSPKNNADPQGWVVKAPNGVRDVVVLFDGIGESSRTPFPDTHFSDLEQRKKANQ